VPTDVVAAAKRRQEASRQHRATICVLGVCFVICSINILMLFVAPSFAKAFELWANLYPVLPRCCGPGYALLQRVRQPQNKLLGAVTRIPSRPVKTNQIVHRRFG